MNILSRDSPDFPIGLLFGIFIKHGIIEHNNYGL